MKINKIDITYRDIAHEQNKINHGMSCLINYNTDKLNQMVTTNDHAQIIEFAKVIYELRQAVAAMQTLVAQVLRAVVVEFANVYDLSPEGGGVLRMEEIARRLRHLLDGFHNNYGRVDAATIEAQPTIVGMGGAGKVNLRAIHMQAYITYYYANLGCKVNSISPKAKNNIHFGPGLDYETLRATHKGDNKKIRKMHASRNFEFYLSISGQSQVSSDISAALLNHAADAFMQVMAMCCRSRTLLTGNYE
nr:Hypothetical protein FSTVLC9_93 [Faustovirus]